MASIVQLTPPENRDYLTGDGEEAINLSEKDPTVPGAQSWGISLWSRYYPAQTSTSYAYLVRIANNKFSRSKSFNLTLHRVTRTGAGYRNPFIEFGNSVSEANIMSVRWSHDSNREGSISQPDPYVSSYPKTSKPVIGVL